MSVPDAGVTADATPLGMTGLTELRAPFPYFGGKAHYATAVWARLGDVTHYIEPFFGSGAVLLGRPDAHAWWDRIETVNDSDGLLANVWRAIPSGSVRPVSGPPPRPTCSVTRALNSGGRHDAIGGVDAALPRGRTR